MRPIFTIATKLPIFESKQLVQSRIFNYTKPFFQYNRRSFTMQAQHGHSAACCNIPPIITKGYQQKGEYKTIGGLKTYVTGPANATKAIIFVFDIFGYFPQTIQGADILSTSHDHEKYLVFMPDFFEGKPADIAWYPPTDETKQKLLGEWFQTQGSPFEGAKKIDPILKSIEKEYSGIKSWGVIGSCWGGKLVSLSAQKGSPFKVGVEVHPAMVDPSEAENITIPLMLLASKDEPAEDVKKFEAALKVEKHVETFPDQIHGWMTARSDLEVEKNKAEYERGYKTALGFFGKHL